ncbi:methyl-accepting chemotaxis protein [Parachitinimonas caeni]|uniref:Methyl-accepting chemotaxis protein n=1 Tax=Parachitinimonas caeni TaxID=3031301 RepID=A0ABT7E2N5_9NEIS|nr:methyl-accepting chemotaxis protein [Parachitinimonas caeni]MDK2126570.1 methyl-accepting chemotaxis protein [Parachitinimonas caeni]
MRFMQRISVKLIALSVVIVTLLLGVSGAVNYGITKGEFEAGLKDQSDALSKRLQLSLPAAIWNFDKNQIGQILEAEMASKVFNGILLSNGKELVDGRVRASDGKLVVASKDSKAEGQKVEVPLHFNDNGQTKQVAIATIFVSRSEMEKLLASALTRVVMQIVILDVLLVLALAAALAVVVIRPLKQLNNALHGIAEGDADLTRRLDESSKDEFGEVSHWFNVFVGRLQQVIKQVADSAVQLAAAAEQTSRITEQAHHGIQLQEQETSQVVMAVGDMTSKVNEISGHTAGASQAAAYADAEADKGRGIVQRAVNAINDASLEVEKAAGVIQELAENSQKIGSVLTVINEIAKQTNLLALNAAIEAARAGEQGRGFAVVADEVRVLANRTHDSTLEIQKVISQLQDGTMRAVSVMERSKEKADAGVKEATMAGSTIDHLAESARKIAELNEGIADSTDQQNTMVHGITQNIHQIQKIVGEAATGAEQTSVASEEVARLAVQLQIMVEQFKV